MPDPRSTDFPAAAGREIISILEASRGRAFVLFTSYAAMRAIQAIAEIELPYPILVQGSAPRSALLEQFRTTPNAVLLATSSFWQGVDVMGEALSCVIIDKLPFASPGDPITAARIEAIAERGGQPFGEYQVPLAILALLAGARPADPSPRRSRRAGGARSAPPDDGLWPPISGVAAAGGHHPRDSTTFDAFSARNEA